MQPQQGGPTSCYDHVGYKAGSVTYPSESAVLGMHPLQSQSKSERKSEQKQQSSHANQWHSVSSLSWCSHQR